MVSMDRPTMLIVLNAIGLVLSVYLVLKHYEVVGDSPICELSSSLSCSRVLTSTWAILLGTPVAVHGVSYFSIALAASLMAAHLIKTDVRTKRDMALGLFCITGVGVLSCVYFVVAEMIIGSVCPLCTVIHICVLITFALSYLIMRDVGGKLSVVDVVDLVLSRSPWFFLAFCIALAPIVVCNLPPMQPQVDESAAIALADCLTARKVKMYGLRTCSHCISQKGLFGATAAKHLPYVECSYDRDSCKKAGVSGYPTWINEDGDVKMGVQSIVMLAEWAKCPLLVEPSTTSS